MIGVDHDRDPVADRPADRAAQTNVLVEAEAELQLDPGKALGDAPMRLLDR